MHDLHVSNLVTYTALAAAVSAVTLALDAGRVHLAAAALGIAAIADTFDGRFARLFQRTERQARYGRDIDSLVDAVAFGAAPIVVIVATVGPSPPLAAAAVFYVLAVVTRLASYNLDEDAAGFVGVPTPAAALLCATALLMPRDAWVGGWPLAVAGAAMIAPLAIPRPRALGLTVFACWAVAVIGLHVMQQ
jgi:CDP-diacylglycerol--serine O-phosphatidyltransferase